MIRALRAGRPRAGRSASRTSRESRNACACRSRRRPWHGCVPTRSPRHFLAPSPRSTCLAGEPTSSRSRPPPLRGSATRSGRRPTLLLRRSPAPPPEGTWAATLRARGRGSQASAATQSAYRQRSRRRSTEPIATSPYCRADRLGMTGFRDRLNATGPGDASCSPLSPLPSERGEERKEEAELSVGVPSQVEIVPPLPVQGL